MDAVLSLTGQFQSIEWNSSRASSGAVMHRDSCVDFGARSLHRKGQLLGAVQSPLKSLRVSAAVYPAKGIIQLSVTVCAGRDHLVFNSGTTWCSCSSNFLAVCSVLLTVEVWLQNDNEKESDAASLSIDLGFPDEDDDQQPGGVYIIVDVNLFPRIIHNQKGRILL